MRLVASEVLSPIGSLALATDAAGRLRGVSFGEGLKRAMAREYPGVGMEPGRAPEAIAAALGPP